jgi:hypothetical protein
MLRLVQLLKLADLSPLGLSPCHLQGRRVTVSTGLLYLDSAQQKRTHCHVTSENHENLRSELRAPDDSAKQEGSCLPTSTKYRSNLSTHFCRSLPITFNLRWSWQDRFSLTWHSKTRTSFQCSTWTTRVIAQSRDFSCKIIYFIPVVRMAKSDDSRIKRNSRRSDDPYFSTSRVTIYVFQIRGHSKSLLRYSVFVRPSLDTEVPDLPRNSRNFQTKKKTSNSNSVLPLFPDSLRLFFPSHSSQSHVFLSFVSINFQNEIFYFPL